MTTPDPHFTSRSDLVAGTPPRRSAIQVEQDTLREIDRADERRRIERRIVQEDADDRELALIEHRQLVADERRALKNAGEL